MSAPATAAPPATVSLAARIALRLLIVFAVGLLLATGGLVVITTLSFNTLDDVALQSQARDVRRHLFVGPDGALGLDLPATLAEAYDRSNGDFAFVVYDALGRPLFSRPTGAPLLFENALLDNAPGTIFRIPSDGPRGRHYGYILSADAIARGARVAVAQTLAHDDVLIDSVVVEYFQFAAWWVLPLVIMTLAVALHTIRKSLAPLARLSEVAAEIGPRQPDVRLPAVNLPREVAPLVSAVNTALDRLAEGFARERRFAADAAHELRTPLAVLAARIDNMDSPDAPELRRDVDRMAMLVNQLLSVARLEALDEAAGHVVDLRRLCLDTLSALAPLALRDGHTLSLTGTERSVSVHGDTAALASALTNLVQNALAVSPRGAEVEVHLDEEAMIAVLDRGPGVPPGERASIFEPFRRSASARGAGSGLGLAIVRRAVEACGGTVAVADRPGGGSVFRIDLGASRCGAEGAAG